MGTARRHPDTDRPWAIETRGISPIPDAERHGRPSDLFSLWFAANIGVLAVTYGGFLVVFYGTNLWQSAVATVVGVLASFLLVGFIGLAGMHAGAPTLVLSRASFGVRGNALPTLVSYVTLIGFEIVLTSLAALAAQTVLERIGVPAGTPTLVASFLVVALAGIGISLLGHATIQQVQKWLTIVFGALTLVFIALQAPQVDWHSVATLRQGSLVGGLLGGLSIIMAGTGLTWTMVAADFTRYLPRTCRSARVVSWTTMGAALPLIILILFGALLAADNPHVATSPNPIGLLAADLPTWFLVPYLVSAVGGLVAEVIMSSYSAGLNLLTLGVRVARHKSIIVDSILMVAGSVYILFIAPSFFAPFEGFLITVAVPLAAWSAIFLVDLLRFRRSGYAEEDLYDPRGRYGAVNAPGILALVVASATGWGLVTSTSPVFAWVGYLLPFVGGRTGAIGASSIGLIISGLLGASIYALLAEVRHRRHGRRTPEAVPPERAASDESAVLG